MSEDAHWTSLWAHFPHRWVATVLFLGFAAATAMGLYVFFHWFNHLSNPISLSNVNFLYVLTLYIGWKAPLLAAVLTGSYALPLWRKHWADGDE